MKRIISFSLVLLAGVTIGAMLPTTKAQSSSSGERAVWYFYRVQWGHQEELVFKDDAQFMLPSPAAELAPVMYSDLDAFHAKERHRFELVDAHWDVPLVEVSME